MLPPEILVTILIGTCFVILFLLIALFSRGKKQRPDQELSAFLTGKLDQVNELAKKIEKMNMIYTIPQQRGRLGELQLESLLKSWLPANLFQMQYQFRNGQRVDAIVKQTNGLVCIDSKFPLELSEEFQAAGDSKKLKKSVERKTKKHIDDISSRYINPSQKTLPFALMYLPSERLYYEILIQYESDIFQYAVSRGVIPVGPSSLFLSLQTISMSSQGAFISQQSGEAVLLIRQLRRELEKVKRGIEISTTHTKNLNKAFAETGNDLQSASELTDKLLQ